MNFKSSILSLFLVIFLSSGSFAQYKYDIGLKVSSYELEQFQLEQRFHLDNPYSLVITYAIGSEWNSNYRESIVYNDSLVDITSDYSFRSNNVIKFGVQRKLGFLASDVFYAGATMGIGLENYLTSSYTATHSIQDSLNFFPYYQYGFSEEIGSTEFTANSRAINAQLALSFGMDVPISKRFSINAELGFAGIYSRSLNYSTAIIRLVPSISGGLRYQFGKKG